jgi:hypothetical protein
MKASGIVHHGRKPLSVIAEEKKKSTFHLYLTNTSSEIDCISVRESAAAGCIPIISNSSVFSERDGFHPGVTDAANREQMVAAAMQVVELALNPDRVSAIRNEIMQSDTIFNWDVVADRWISTMFD